ncbi:MAG TPA: ABC transporter permease [Bryobacteraceae bacterium]|nr:ABC transporter permease [Bryobacteraceae bacterium]
MRPTRGLDSWWLDFKLGLRMLIKYPGLALVGIFGIAVAVAIATGGFSVIYGNFIEPSLPLQEGDRIVSIELWDSPASKPERRILSDFLRWREELKSVQEISAFRNATPNLIAPGGKTESIRVAMMTASGFRVARVQPLIGRLFTDHDEREGAAPVIVIGETVWRNRFAADPAILGRTLQLGAVVHTVVGVMPASFAFPVNHDFWAPLRASMTAEPLTGPELMVFGRLAPGSTIESARAELNTVGRRRARELPKIYAELQPQAMPYANPFLGIHGPGDIMGLHAMNGLIITLLVLVSFNIAILVYTRTAMRGAEISLRTALGASRGRIVAQLFIEALVMSTVGTAIGVAIAEFALRQLAAATLHVAADLPFWLSFHLSGKAVLYAALLSVLAAAIVGVAPALQATRRELSSKTRVVGTGSSDLRLGWMWTTLVIAQVGFAVALLPGAVTATVDNLRSELIDRGFRSEEFLTAQLDIDPALSTADLYTGRHTELARRLQADPRVSTTTFATAIPGDEPDTVIDTHAQQSGHHVRVNRVDVNFFGAFEVPILAGRAFQPSDAESPTSQASAVIVNHSFAQRIFGGDALGQRVRYAQASDRWYEIVGIVPDFPAGVSPGMNDSPLRMYHAIAPGQAQPLNIMLRMRSANPSAFTQRLNEHAAAVDPDLQVRNIQTLEEALRKEQWIRRTEAAVLAAICASVLLLSSAGIYALMAFTVSQRRKEIGIRMALGADRTRIVAGIFSRAFAQLATGAVLGMAMAAQLWQTSNGNVQSDKSLVLAGVAIFMMAVGCLAALGPARRCLAIEPTEALREQ